MHLGGSGVALGTSLDLNVPLSTKMSVCNQSPSFGIVTYGQYLAQIKLVIHLWNEHVPEVGRIWCVVWCIVAVVSLIWRHQILDLHFWLKWFLRVTVLEFAFGHIALFFYAKMMEKKTYPSHGWRSKQKFPPHARRQRKQVSAPYLKTIKISAHPMPFCTDPMPHSGEDCSVIILFDPLVTV